MTKQFRRQVIFNNLIIRITIIFYYMVTRNKKLIKI
jgi:hypothetical protein